MVTGMKEWSLYSQWMWCFFVVAKQMVTMGVLTDSTESCDFTESTWCQLANCWCALGIHILGIICFAILFEAWLGIANSSYSITESGPRDNGEGGADGDSLEMTPRTPQSA